MYTIVPPLWKIFEAWHFIYRLYRLPKRCSPFFWKDSTPVKNKKQKKTHVPFKGKKKKGEKRVGFQYVT